MRFKITYMDPDTEELVSVYKEFEDTDTLKSSEWAEDYAYAKADKGFYVITTAPEV